MCLSRLVPAAIWVQCLKHESLISKLVNHPFGNHELLKSLCLFFCFRTCYQANSKPGDLRNTIATAGVLGGVTGLLFGGFWLGAASFVATSYLAKKAICHRFPLFCGGGTADALRERERETSKWTCNFQYLPMISNAKRVISGKDGKHLVFLWCSLRMLWLAR